MIIGKGPEEARLRQLAGDAANIRFLGWASDETIRWHYQHCQALLFPGEEDFGIVPLEVQGCGRPVIAYGAGGALETVVPLGQEGPTGVLFGEQSVESLRAALDVYERNAAAFDSAAARGNALRFTWPGFAAGMRDRVGELLEAARR